MEAKRQVKLGFQGVDIINVHYTSRRPYSNEDTIDFSANPKVFFPEEVKNEFKILMNVSLVSKDCFEMELLAIGNFLFDRDVDENERKGLINANAPAIMFPYVRAFISTFTSNLGGVTTPIILPAQIFSGELEELILSSVIEDK